MLDSPPGTPGRWQSDPRRKFLRDELASKTATELADMYWEAIRVLDDGSNPERLPICAFLLRELQIGLPTYLNLPQPKPRRTAGSVIDWVELEWNRLAAKPGRIVDGRWTGPLDGPIASFLRALGERIDQYRSDNPRWRAEQRRVLRTLDPSLGTIPDEVQTDVVKTWDGLRDFFNTWTHHSAVEDTDFEEKVRAFESFLGDRLVPQTFAKRDQIAAMVREAEGHALN